MSSKNPKRAAGRPPLPHPREFAVSIRFSLDERAAIEQAALARGLTVPEFVRAQLAALMGVGGRHWPVEPRSQAPSIARRA
jgi:hypothetical protein